MASLADLQQRLEMLVDAIGEHDEDLRSYAETWWRVGQWPTGRWVIYDDRKAAAVIVLDLGGTKGEASTTLYTLTQWQYQLARHRREYTMVASPRGAGT